MCAPAEQGATQYMAAVGNDLRRTDHAERGTPDFAIVQRQCLNLLEVASTLSDPRHYIINTGSGKVCASLWPALSNGVVLLQITMGGWIMNIAWLIFAVWAWLAFEDPLQVQKKR